MPSHVRHATAASPPAAAGGGWAPRVRRVLRRAEEESGLEALRLLVAALRPTSEEDPAAELDGLVAYLRTDAAAAAALRELLHDFVGWLRLCPGLSESGVDGGEGFVTETLARLGRKFLPPSPDAADVRDALTLVFDEPRDHVWVAEVPEEDWRALLEVLAIGEADGPTMDDEVASATRVLTHHASSLGLQPQVLERMADADGPSPFLSLGDSVLRYLDSFQDRIPDNEAPRLSDALDDVARCREAVERLRREKNVRGTSVWLTSASARLLLILERLDLLLRLTGTDAHEVRASLVRLTRTMLEAEKTRDHLIPHLRASADLLALEVVEHAARKGSKYITRGRRDYGRFLVSSLGGGLIVALFAMFKAEMAGWDLPLGIQAMAYGLNYALCFVLIYLTGATLATKQPAMTANTLARSLGRSGHDLEGLEELIVRVWRSQFVSFVGNLAMALPVAFLLTHLISTLVDQPWVSTERAGSMLQDLHPWRSGTVAYAAIAGVLLFAAGLVSGWVDNWTVHRRLRERLLGDSRLVRIFGRHRLTRLAELMHEKLGAVAGNVFLGFGLGSLGTLGVILGLPLDIRHIAFASAELGIALDALDFRVATELLVAVGVGIGLIGLLNFLVSFGLSLAVALESRAVAFRDYRRLLTHLFHRFLRRPLDWFFPPSEPRTKRPPSGTPSTAA